jgi:hypothetical protein
MASERYPGYDVLSKRDSPSWNEQTRRVIDARLALDPARHRFFSAPEWQLACAICARVIPQASGPAPTVPLAAMLDQKLFEDRREGYRDARLPPQQEAWRRALRAIDAQARDAHGGRAFSQLDEAEQDGVLQLIQRGDPVHPAWNDMPPAVFFAKRLLHDIVSAYYSHPLAWNQIGFGGPASPRGYVRMGFDRHDPWEAAEAKPGQEQQARRENSRVGSG